MQEKTKRLTYRRPIRMFEHAGTVDPQTSYYVNRDNVTNTNKEDFKSMMDSGRYFSMFAPRQSGKYHLTNHISLTKCEPTIYPVGDKKIIAFIIGIGKDNKF